jgi:hypothetical protein
MSQKKVYDILDSLGGRATISTIREEAKHQYPDATLWKYVGYRLHTMKKWGIVDFDNVRREWYIVKSYE